MGFQGKFERSSYVGSPMFLWIFKGSQVERSSHVGSPFVVGLNPLGTFHFCNLFWGGCCFCSGSRVWRSKILACTLTGAQKRTSPTGRNRHRSQPGGHPKGNSAFENSGCLACSRLEVSWLCLLVLVAGFTGVITFVGGWNSR